MGLMYRKPVRREELTARIDIHTAAKENTPWINSLVSGSTNKDTEAMQLLQAILPERIITKIQVCGAYPGFKSASKIPSGMSFLAALHFQCLIGSCNILSYHE